MDNFYTENKNKVMNERKMISMFQRYYEEDEK